MCGIVGIIGNKDVAEALLEGLQRLEYRGYDSAGIATVANGKIARIRAEGKLKNLDAALRKSPLKGVTGIGHTRWATHGIPNETNAHPHATGQVAVVHNGIIENFQSLREEMQAAGHVFYSETDTEVIPVLISHYLAQGHSPKDAFAATLKRLEGAFAIGAIFAANPEVIMAARRGSPLAVGYGDDEMFMASDAIALAPYTTKVSYLEEGDWAEIHRDRVVFYDRDNANVTRAVKVTAISSASVGKGNYRHYMLKEIFEQPGVIGETLHSYYNPVHQQIQLPELPFDLAAITRVTLVACGTSYYAAMVARYWLEDLTGIPVDTDIASEFRYRRVPFQPGGLVVCISQSGETADTLAALRFAKENAQHSIVVVNVPESTMAREADAVLRIVAGPEIGVASTKAFTAQLTTLACFAIAFARARGSIAHDKEARLVHALSEVPARAAEVLEHSDAIAQMAHRIAEARDVLYIGRGTSFAVAMEGALKLKEISYIHAEGYAAGELKHGPIALIDEHTPVIAIAPGDALFDKTASNIQEVAAREGKIVLISDSKGVQTLGKLALATITIPEVSPFVSPILYAIPVQLLAYHVAVLKGTDVDQPRNLAKSVTVE
ncbi:MAG: glutamine--fructose-6-phosphate transaminase (isomerizing) [Alphaproteobacteria bacterium]|nr:glutamine--fructose-6-phosphate transaminase (isomerizing) [Alphaproteobacteria bacterium]